MPERTHQFGVYGAQGQLGSQAAARVLDSLVSGIASPVTTRRGLRARLRYLTRSAAGREAIREAGITVTERTLRAWIAERQRPNAANFEKLDAAYWRLRRRNVARHLLQRLNSRGGTRVEIHPLNQTEVQVPRQRILEYRRLNIRQWDTIVDAWAVGDAHALDDAWIDQITELGSQWGQYEYVTNVGFAA